MPKRGLTMKIFAFTYILVTIVITVSFGILYLVLPDFYLKEKNEQLDKNTTLLAKNLSAAGDVNVYAMLIRDFSAGNNAFVTPFDENRKLIIELSSPFLMMDEADHGVHTLMAFNIQQYGISAEGTGNEPTGSAWAALAKPASGRTSAVITAPGSIAKKAEPASSADSSDQKSAAFPTSVQESTQQGQPSPESDSEKRFFFKTNRDLEISNNDRFEHVSIGVTGIAEDETFYIRSSSEATLMTKPVDSGLIREIAVSSTLQPIDEAKGVLISLIPYLLILDFLIALVATYLFSRQLTKPILKISDSTISMRELKSDVLSNVRTNDELGVLSKNLDSMYLNLHDNIHHLKVEMAKVAALEQSKTEFMRAAGHELKTPIAALNGIVEGMIDNVGRYQDREKYLNECKGQIGKLAKLVNEILLSSQADSVKGGEDYEEVAAGPLLDEVAEQFSILMEEKKLTLLREYEDPTISIETDRQLFRQALTNILSNAVLYSPPLGTVTLRLNPTSLSVENRCDPIPEDQLQRLTEPFYTPNYSRSKAESGTGLGLYIVQKNLDRLGMPLLIENTETGLCVRIQFDECAKPTLVV